jgi:hypothetical protein
MGFAIVCGYKKKKKNSVKTKVVKEKKRLVKRLKNMDNENNCSLVSQGSREEKRKGYLVNKKLNCLQASIIFYIIILKACFACF